MQHRLQYNNAAQQWWYSTILVVNTILYTGKFAKMVHQIFFGQNGTVVGVIITLTWKINDCRDEDTGSQNSKPSTLFFPLSSAYYITSIAF